MTAKTEYQQLCQHFRTISHFEHFSALGDWDQATMMPMGGSEARSEAMAELALHIHSLKTSPRLAEWLDSAEAKAAELSIEQQANLREMRWHYAQAIAVPGDLVQAKTLAGYRCENQWREQRHNNDWQGFRPNLEAVIALVREEAQARSAHTGKAGYDALLDRFEPGMTCERLETTLGAVRDWLPELIQKVKHKQLHQSYKSSAGDYPIADQKLLGREVMQYLGFDFNQGRLDVSSHPFCGGVPGDIRLTSRYTEDDFIAALTSTIHETGHARYEQALPKDWREQPAGMARSMGIHESQSLFFEMQLGGSRAFISKLYPRIRRHLDCPVSAHELVDNITRVKPGLIRVDADEVTYPAHILLRFEAEQAFIDGSLEVKDLPDFWDQKMQQYLGLSTAGNYKDGCMQDIHWTLGELGYFPSYTLGAMYAAQLRFAMEAELGPIEALLSQDKLGQICDWLDEKIWSKGCLLETDELIRSATGQSLDPNFLQRHLQQRYLD